jgi:hypothetical protein
MLQHSKEHPH